MLTVLYSPTKVSGPSVNCAVTFSLPGVPSSNFSTCINICKLRMTSNSRILALALQTLTYCYSAVKKKKAQSHKTFILVQCQNLPRKHMHSSYAVYSNLMQREESLGSTCLSRYTLSDECYTMCFHVGTYFFCHFLVKAPKKYGTHHYCDIQTQTSKKSCTLQSHIRSTHNQRFARTIRQGEEVITKKRRSIGYKVLRRQTCLCKYWSRQNSVYYAFSSHLVIQYSLSPGIPRYLGLSPVARTKVSAV